MLTALPSTEELEIVIKSFKKGKAPGSHGFPVEFYQVSWPIIKWDILKANHRFFQPGYLSMQINHTLLTTSLPTCVNGYRPVSLFNVFYKIISKLLATKLKLVISKCIEGNQSAFLPGSRIGDSLF